MKKNRIASIAVYLGAAAISLVMVFPLLWMISSSLKPTRDIFAETLRLIPRRVTFGAYESLRSLAGLPFMTYMWNSLFIVGLSVAVSVAVTSLGAYAMNRKPRLPGFHLLENMFILSMMYPYILLMTPVYVVIYKLGLLGTRTGIILFLALGPIQYYLFREFFSKVPRAIIESAEIDGARELQIFSSIVAPMAKSVFMTAILLTFILNWDNWFPVLIISTSMKTYTLPVALFNLDSQLEVNFPEIMALSTVVSLPIMLIFILTQKKVIAGFAAGGVKG
jgi:ABC-type glycerol-3-phosphate transport system permease component